jgi:hypothetical protein
MVRKNDTSSILCEKRTTQKISILQENQEGGSVLRTTNAVRGKISHILAGYS